MPKGWVFDFSSIQKVKDLRAVAKKAQNIDGTIEIITTYCVEWPYDGDPSSEEAVDELTIEEWTEAQQQMLSAYDKIFRKS